MSRKRADILLVEKGLFDSRAKARAAIEAGRVTVDGKVVAKASEAIDEAGDIVAEAAHPWVGRGALKLVRALELWPVLVEGRIAVDVGASTGGFTEVLLAKGATRVLAVDVGRDQLHPSLKADARVADLSPLDARALTAEHAPGGVDLIVTDVSFISLEKALPAALALAGPGADLVALVKPQFEAGRENVGKGGLVKDPEIIAACVGAVSTFLEASGWTVRDSADSPITGGEGQVEKLLWAVKG
ncbi:TlyA family rRNA (cytidine-2'-O)-methyltransferase [Caulobacter flavus]|uniref:TlyA family rRNA (Cytidine-2'-O)-methyltransferase n=1 Tax=Caulobacter flavus TaxID=1679497 RepID=A0A2N5CL41_9CAUL|nr:TlyA family RNA methyltransferase [Caulobacter flavus]AYV48296.1 TlyA family rRNA (cytidine-2'-O)-methyltransferase [Caulobacter flavus]PLR06455.1 TlyA family rRNA (cytidine-2'-O)-methyltransferase [Caulobacter flavus]